MRARALRREWRDSPARAAASVFPSRGHGTESGFSLLEVIVAFAILAITLGILIQIFSNAASTTLLSGEYSRAATLAEARLDDVGIDIPLEPGSYSGDPEEGLTWQVVIEPYLPEDLTWEPSFAIFLVTARVAWGEEGGKEREIVLATLRIGDNSGAAGLDSIDSRKLPQPRQDALER